MTDRPDKIRTWNYSLGDGWEALAGRTDVDNDILTFSIAAPTDLWLHAKGVPGSHVVLRHAHETEVPKDILQQAAAIAAWHSKARNGGTVPVNVTRACDVHKARGAKAGSVRIKRERSLKVRPSLPGPDSERRPPDSVS